MIIADKGELVGEQHFRRALLWGDAQLAVMQGFRCGHELPQPELYSLHGTLFLETSEEVRPSQ